VKRALQIVLFLTFAVLLYGCGYSLVAKNSAIPRGQTVDVRMFANRTFQPNVEGEFRRALVSELVSRGHAAGDDSSDYLISGEIAALSIETTAFSAIDRAMMYRVAVEIQMQLTERKSGKVVWKGAESVRQDYPATADLALQRNAREAAVTSICARAAQLLATRMDQAF
jgi:hypothetical protein